RTARRGRRLAVFSQADGASARAWHQLPAAGQEQARRGAGSRRRTPGGGGHFPRRHVDSAAVAGALRRAWWGAGTAASRPARFQAEPRQRALDQRVAAALRELQPTSERSAARLEAFSRRRAFTPRRGVAV